MSDDTITISRSEYDELRLDQLWLRALESAGVDNWEGYDYASDLYREEAARERG